MSCSNTLALVSAWPSFLILAGLSCRAEKWGPKPVGSMEMANTLFHTLVMRKFMDAFLPLKCPGKGVNSHLRIFFE